MHWGSQERGEVGAPRRRRGRGRGPVVLVLAAVTGFVGSIGHAAPAGSVDPAVIVAEQAESSVSAADPAAMAPSSVPPSVAPPTAHASDVPADTPTETPTEAIEEGSAHDDEDTPAPTVDEAVRGAVEVVVDLVPLAPEPAPPVPEPAPPVPEPAPPVLEPAAAPTPQTPPAPVDTRPRHEVVGAEALARLRHLDISGWGWTIDFHEGRAGYLGVTDSNRKVVDVWVRDHHTVEHVMGTLAHELAHVYDREVWTPAIRDQWLALRGVDLAWWPTCTCDDRGFGAGDIAEAMVVLEVGPGQWTGRHGLPNAEQLAFLASIV